MTVRSRIRLWLAGTTLAFSLVGIQLAIEMAAVIGQQQAATAASSDLSALARFDARLASEGPARPSNPAWASWAAAAGPAAEQVDRARMWLDRIDHVALGSNTEHASDLRWYVRKSAAELRAAAAVISQQQGATWESMARGLLLAYILLFAGAAGWYLLQVIPQKGVTIVTTPAGAKKPAEASVLQLPGSNNAHVRHELRTPLTVMLGYAAELESQLEGDLKEFATAIRDSGNRMHATLEDLLSYADLTDEHGPLRSEPVEVHEIVEAVIRKVRPSAFDKRLQFVYRATPAEAWVLSHSEGLRSAVLHLVENAVKYTPSGSVSVAVEADAERIRISVEDSGDGFDESRLSELSAPFVQGSTGDARQYDGVGLGLTIARRVAESGGGRLTASSVPGVGSRFTITLPRHIREARRAA